MDIRKLLLNVVETGHSLALYPFVVSADIQMSKYFDKAGRDDYSIRKLLSINLHNLMDPAVRSVLSTVIANKVVQPGYLGGEWFKCLIQIAAICGSNVSYVSIVKYWIDEEYGCENKDDVYAWLFVVNEWACDCTSIEKPVCWLVRSYLATAGGGNENEVIPYLSYACLGRRSLRSKVSDTDEPNSLDKGGLRYSGDTPFDVYNYFKGDSKKHSFMFHAFHDLWKNTKLPNEILDGMFFTEILCIIRNEYHTDDEYDGVIKSTINKILEYRGDIISHYISKGMSERLIATAPVSLYEKSFGPVFVFTLAASRHGVIPLQSAIMQFLWGDKLNWWTKAEGLTYRRLIAYFVSCGVLEQNVVQTIREFEDIDFNLVISPATICGMLCKFIGIEEIDTGLVFRAIALCMGNNCNRDVVANEVKELVSKEWGSYVREALSILYAWTGHPILEPCYVKIRCMESIRDK